MKRINSRAFTLIELLVVVTIIVVLLAMLTPALDKAIYSAELASCAAQQDGVATGAVTYSMNNKRRYPYRAGTNEATSGNYFPMYITLPFNPVHNKGNPFGYDDRALFRPYMSIKALLCPLAPAPVDLEGAPSDSFICSSYSLWFGWKYMPDSSLPASRGFEKYGLPWTWEGRKYKVMMGDTHGRWVFAPFFAHADRDGMATGRVRQEEAWGGGPPVGTDKNTFSLWEVVSGQFPPGPQLDTNYAFEDGSVRGYKDVYADTSWNIFIKQEEHFNTVPLYHRPTTGNYPAGWLAIPKEN